MTLKGDGLEWLDFNLPTPTFFQHSTDASSRIYFIGWALNGHFGTNKSYQYLSEIKARLALTLLEYEPRILDFKPSLDSYMETAKIHLVKYRLENFSTNLKSLPSQKETTWRAEYESALERERKRLNHATKKKLDEDRFTREDPLFEASRHTIYRFAYANGLEALSYEYVLMTVEVANMVLNKSPSDCKNKAKAIFAFMIEKFIIYNRQYESWTKDQRASYMRKYRKENSTMTREENMKRVNNKRKESTRGKIIAATTSLSYFEYLKKNGTWNVIKIAEETGVGRATVSQYLKALISEGKIQEVVKA